MSEYVSMAIYDAVQQINRTIFLPDIQRPFVWEQEQIYKLLDSLLRRYPISTMLFWELSKESLAGVQTRDLTTIKMYRFVDSNGRKNEEELKRERDKYFLVLDGQQRLTSLFIALAGYWIEKKSSITVRKELFFNALSGREEDENGLRYEFEFREAFGRDVAFESAGADPGKVWINIKRIFEADLGLSKNKRAFVENVVKGLGLSAEQIESIEDRVGDLNYVLRARKAINYFPESEDDYEKVLDIFVRTNSGGTKLGFSDLLFSKIKFFWGSARDNFDELIEKLEINNIEFETDFVLKTCLVLFATKADEMRYNRIRNLNERLIANIKDHWESIKTALLLVRDLIQDDFRIRHKRLLPSFHALIPLVYWCYKKGKNAIMTDDATDISERIAMRKWLVKALLSGAFGGQADAVLYKAKEAMDKNFDSPVFPADRIEQSIAELKGRAMGLSSDVIDNFEYQSKESHLFLILCYGKDIDFQPNIKRHLPEQDHIFCKDELRQKGYDGELINSIYNIRFVSLKDNRSKLNTPYREWIASCGDQIENIKKRHMIPEGDWTVETFKDFLSKRRELMLRQLQYVLL